MTDESLRYQQALLRVVQGRPIAFYGAYAHALGSVTAALLLSQLCYWSDKGHDADGWIYKTQAELEAETGMGRREQETARRQLRAARVLEEKKAGTPARLYFRVDFERLVDLLSKDGGKRHPRMAESATQAGRKAPGIHTETTPERLEQVWVRTISQLRPSMSAPNFGLWFPETTLTQLTGSTATIAAPAAQHQGLVRLERQLCKALSQASGRPISQVTLARR